MTTVASQTSPSSKVIQKENHVIATERISGNQTGSELVLFFNCSSICPTDFHESEEHTTTTFTGDTTIPPLTTTTRLFEVSFVRDEQTN